MILNITTKTFAKCIFYKMWIIPYLLIFLHCTLRIITICTQRTMKQAASAIFFPTAKRPNWPLRLSWPRFSKVRLIFLFEVHSEIVWWSKARLLPELGPITIFMIPNQITINGKIWSHIRSWSLSAKKWSDQWSDCDLWSFFWSFCRLFSNFSQPLIWIIFSHLNSIL